MQKHVEALALDVATLRHRFGDFERHLEKRRPIVVFAMRPSEDAEALAGCLRPLQTLRDDRSDWRAMRDTWRMRHFSTCLGLATRSGYAWRVEEAGPRISVVFEPAAQQGQRDRGDCQGA
jgi:hypothetical protein